MANALLTFQKDVGVLRDEQSHDEVADARQRERSRVPSLGVRLVDGKQGGQEKNGLAILLDGRQHRRARDSVVDLLKHALEIEHRAPHFNESSCILADLGALLALNFICAPLFASVTARSAHHVAKSGLSIRIRAHQPCSGLGLDHRGRSRRGLRQVRLLIWSAACISVSAMASIAMAFFIAA